MCVLVSVALRKQRFDKKKWLESNGRTPLRLRGLLQPLLVMYRTARGKHPGIYVMQTGTIIRLYMCDVDIAITFTQIARSLRALKSQYRWLGSSRGHHRNMGPI